MKDWQDKNAVASFFKARELTTNTPGVPVAGIHRYGNHRSTGCRNPAGDTQSSMEWSAKARKEEARLRGLNNRARRNAIKDQLNNN